MKKLLCFLAAAVVLPFTVTHAGTISGVSNYEETPASGMGIPFEFSAEYSYIGDGTVQRDNRVVRDFDETYSFLQFVYTPRVKIGIVRLGATWERFGFGFQGNTQLEDALQSVSAVIGFDTQLSESILIRLEAQPGLYGSADDLRGDTFMVPFLLGGTYLYSSDLQFVAGVSVNFDRQFPVFPGGGLRWRLSSRFVLNAVVPTPRLEFEYNPNVTFFLGANLKGSTFRVSENFGSRQAGDAQLNNAVIDYTEVRIGLGAELKLSPQVKLTLEGGYLPYREFDYHRTEVRYHHEDGAAYGSVGFRAAF